MQENTEKIRFILNQAEVEERLNPGVVLLDYLRLQRRMTGTRFACGEGDCGSCLVLLGELKPQGLVYRPVNACLLPLGSLVNCHIVTVEGLNTDQLNPIQQVLIDAGAVQCGFCMPGLVLALTAFFLNASELNNTEMLDAVAGNLCRCSGYMGIKRAISQLSSDYGFDGCDQTERLAQLVKWRILPDYFLTLEDRLSVLATIVETKAEDQAVLVAGGSDLWVQQAEALLNKPLSFLKQDPALSGIKVSGQRVTIGAATIIEELRKHPLMASLSSTISNDFKMICANSIRQQATVGGNLVNASPIGDLSIFFLALNATIQLTDKQQSRQLTLRDFFKAYKQVELNANERLTAISFDLPKTTQCFSFEKVSKRRYLDIASVNSALQIQMDGDCIDRVHLSAGGVAAYPMYLTETCAYLQGQTLKPETLKKALAISQGEIDPISDIRGSADYKRLLLRQLIIAHFLKLFPSIISWRALL